jgi:hypothetical protein
MVQFADVHMIPSSNPAAVFYYPVVFPNEFWHVSSSSAYVQTFRTNNSAQLQSHYNPVSPANQSLPLRITLNPISQFKFQLFASMSHSFSQAAQQKGAATSELDEVKRMLIETNPILLIVTAIVSALHMVFEFLGMFFLQHTTS